MRLTFTTLLLKRCFDACRYNASRETLQNKDLAPIMFLVKHNVYGSIAKFGKVGKNEARRANKLSETRRVPAKLSKIVKNRLKMLKN